jgi:HJR/Mrr/RecB family endonuclease
MAVKEISEDEFNEYNIRRASSAMIAREEEWFADDEAKLLGTVLFDTYGKDWGYIILALESDGVYRFATAEVSIPKSMECRIMLKNAMSGISTEGKVSEKLFELGYSDTASNNSSLVIRDINEEVKKYFSRFPEKLYELHPTKFEELIASIFVDLGFDIELTKATRDGGRDIIVRIKNAVMNILTYVECKRYSADNKIDVGIIREVAGVHYIRKPSKSIIVTTSFFTKDAIVEAKTLENQLELKDFNSIKEWLKRY